MKSCVTMALCGAGMRGQYAYAPYIKAHPSEARFVAVADPDEARRISFAADHAVPQDQVFTDYRELLSRPALADALMICTMDNDHVEPALMALQAGYRHILLEKPIDKDMDKCAELVKAAQAVGANVQVCHSLRYTRFYRKLRSIIASKRLGDLVNIVHVEGVGYFHQAHSFVRGNWAKGEETSPMILQKCCHDTDLMLYLIGEDCRSVSSYGALTFFKPENAPQGSADRCWNCPAREGCAYDAAVIYGPGGQWNGENVAKREGFETVDEMLMHGRYGRCVFRCGNDVVDHQVVNMLFDREITASMTMSAFTRDMDRETRIMFTHGEVYAALGPSTIKISDFATKDEELINVSYGASGHSGADDLIMRDFIGSVRGDVEPVTDIALSVRSHQMAMAAEKSMREGRTIEI